MKLDSLPRYERPACEHCKTMAPECIVPIGDGSASLCWLCAHDATEHADGSKCTCSGSEIYPAHVLAARAQPPLVERERFVVTSSCYDETGRRDRNGPKLVQTFEHVAPGKIRIVGVELREPTRGEKISRYYHENLQAFRK